MCGSLSKIPESYSGLVDECRKECQRSLAYAMRNAYGIAFGCVWVQPKTEQKALHCGADRSMIPAALD
jgi:hypothetical protein